MRGYTLRPSLQPKNAPRTMDAIGTSLVDIRRSFRCLTFKV